MLFFVLISFLQFSIPTNAKLFPIAVRLPLNGTPPLNGASLWPQPVSLDVRTEHYFIDKERFSIKRINLNRCELDIIDKLWAHYTNVLFPPKIPYKRPESNEKQTNTLTFRLLNSNPSSDVDCVKEYYPYFEETESESCRKFEFLIL